ncbi:PO21 protein, partial [Scytalopus superciliaris]|nr:PO21 protein [Scytalopus superciliaris]
FITLTASIYDNINTYIDPRMSSQIPSGFRLGVCDPMSPILFNLAVDPLLWNLEEEGCGYQHCVKNLTSMTFADDLVLLSGSWEGMKRNIEILEAFCDLTGLRVQGEK